MTEKETNDSHIIELNEVIESFKKLELPGNDFTLENYVEAYLTLKKIQKL